CGLGEAWKPSPPQTTDDPASSRLDTPLPHLARAATRCKARPMPKNELERTRENRGRRIARLEQRMTRLERLAEELAQLTDELRTVVAPRPALSLVESDQDGFGSTRSQ